MGFYINFCTNVMSGHVMSGLTLFSPTCVLDFRVPPLRFKVQSSAISHPFWTFSCLPSASRSNPPLFLAPFGLPRASPPPQSPIHSPFSLLLDFLVPLLRFKVQSSSPSRSFWTFSCLSSASRSNPQLFLALFGLPRASPLPQGPIRRYFSLLLDFLLPLHFKVQSSALSHSFWTSSCLSSASKSNPPLFLTPFGLPRASPPPQGQFRHAPAPHHAKKADCKAIRQSQSANSNPPVSINQSNPPSANSTK